MRAINTMNKISTKFTGEKIENVLLRKEMDLHKISCGIFNNFYVINYRQDFVPEIVGEITDSSI